MADGVAALIFFILLIAFGWSGGCNMKGPGLTIRVDNTVHHVLLGDH